MSGEINNPACPCWSGYCFMHRGRCGCPRCEMPPVPRDPESGGGDSAVPPKPAVTAPAPPTPKD